MRRRLRLRDILVVYPLIWVADSRRSADIGRRRRQADYLRPGSLTYNRQVAQQRHHWQL